MGVATAQENLAAKPALLFIDDEPRVLKSMRAMFRRDFEVHLANSGEEALQIAASQPIQVVVSDQRMPHMTGVEVLTEIKHTYPHIVRILLTGYADLEAIEASLNEAEVFKYLMKPCPADEIRSAVQAGLDELQPTHTAEVITLTVPGTSRTESAAKPRLAAASPPIADDATLAQVDNQRPPQQAPRATASPAVQPPLTKTPALRGHIALLGSHELVEPIKAAAPRAKVHPVASLTEAINMNDQHPLTVLIADLPPDAIPAVSREIQRQMPNVVTLTASDRSDAELLIDLINAGIVYRFLMKPIQSGRLQLTLNSAFERYHAHEGHDPAKPTNRWSRFVDWLVGRGA